MNLKCIMAKGLKYLLNPPALNRCRIDKTAKVCPRSELNRTELGRYSYVGGQCFMDNVKIGCFCSIADRCVIGGATHPMDRVSMSPVFHSGKNILKKNFVQLPPIETPQTEIGNDVWIGMGCFLKAGVKIGDGAVIGMGSVVTKDVPAYEIWAGNPAKKIRDRFSEHIKRGLQESRWWTWDDARIERNAKYMEDPSAFLERIGLTGEKELSPGEDIKFGTDKESL